MVGARQRTGGMVGMGRSEREAEMDGERYPCCELQASKARCKHACVAGCRLPRPRWDSKYVMARDAGRQQCLWHRSDCVWRFVADGMTPEM